jgi:hypothetical protein
MIPATFTIQILAFDHLAISLFSLADTHTFNLLGLRLKDNLGNIFTSNTFFEKYTGFIIALLAAEVSL